MRKLVITMNCRAPKQRAGKQVVADIEKLVRGINRHRAAGITHIVFRRSSSYEHVYVTTAKNAGDVLLVINLQTIKWWTENLYGTTRVREFIVKSCRWARKHLVGTFLFDQRLTIYSTQRRCPFTLD